MAKLSITPPRLFCWLTPLTSSKASARRVAPTALIRSFSMERLDGDIASVTGPAPRVRSRGA